MCSQVWGHDRVSQKTSAVAYSGKSMAMAEQDDNRHYELSPATYDFYRADACLLGLGVGVLVAAAVSMSPSIGELSARGVEVVRITFRCALLVDGIARTLDTFDVESTAQNWIYVLLNEDEQRVRDELEKAQPSNVSPSQCKPGIQSKNLMESRQLTISDRALHIQVKSLLLTQDRMALALVVRHRESSACLKRCLTFVNPILFACNATVAQSMQITPSMMKMSIAS